MDGGNRKCGGESQENNSLEVIRGIEERISPATQSRNWWGPWSSAPVHQNLCAFISTCAPIQTPVPPLCPLKSYANLCTLHLSLPICSQTCTCTLSAEFFSSRSCIIDANPLHWHGTRTEVGRKEVQRQPCSWMRTCSSTQPIPMQSNHFNFHKPHMCANIQHMFIRSCQNCDQNWYSFCVSRALGEVFLMEKSTNFTLKQNTVGGREKGENTSPPALKKSVRLWIFWCCYIWNVKNKKGAKGEMVQMKIGWKLCFLGSPSLSLSLTWPALSEKLWKGVWS